MAASGWRGWLTVFLLATVFSTAAFAQGAGEGRHRLPALKAHGDGHSLETEDGRPFFWLGDTAWELIHHTTREEASYYLKARAEQGFTVIQTVVLSEFDGVTAPSALGLKPLIDNDPKRPNPAYFDRVVELVEEAESRGLYVALVPIWGDKLTAPWGTGPRLFRTDNLADAREFARYLGGRLKGHANVVWMLGGDRPARLAGMHNDYLQNLAKQAGFGADADWTPIWREVAAGIEQGWGRKPLIVYHPQGGSESSSLYLHEEPWLTVNGMQSGHGGGHDVPVWEWVARDYAKAPAKPTLDLEPNYEDTAYNQWPKWDPATGFFRDVDVRKQVYRSVFAGACGVSYGHNSVWGFFGARNEPLLWADRGWVDALNRPGGRQMRFLRELVESRPFFRRMPDQSLIVGDAGQGGSHVQATRDSRGSYAFVYIPREDQTVTVDLSKLRGRRFQAWWYDPRSGVGTVIGKYEAGGKVEFRTPPEGPDWVLVLDAEDEGYAPPGLMPWGGGD